MRALSIDIGTSHFTVIEGTTKKGSVEITKAVTADLPQIGSVESINFDSGGAASAISNVLKENNFNAKNAVITININNIMIRDFVLPETKPKQLSGMVRYEMMQNYSAADTDIIQFIKCKNEDDKSQAAIKAVAIKREIVDAYYGILKKLKLKPIAMDFHANAVRKLFCNGTMINKKDMSGKSFILIDFGSSGTLTHAITDGEIFISRYIPLGINDLDELVAGKEFLTAEQAAEYRKEKLNLSTDDTASSSAMQGVNTFFHQWNDELQKVIRFFLTQKRIDAIDGLYLYGAGSLIKGLPEYLKASMGTDTYPIEEISKIKFINYNDENKIHNCINAAGAMLRL